MPDHLFPLGAHKDQQDFRDYRLSKIESPVALPESVTYEDQMSPIRDQGHRGSCVAHATVAVKEWQERKASQFATPLDLSEEWIYDQIMLPGGGAYPREAMKLLDKVGVCPEVDMPYKPLRSDDKKRYFRPSAKAKQDAASYTAKTYVRLSTIDEMLQSLASHGPFTLAVDWLDGWFNPSERDGGGYPVLRPTEGNVAGGHDIAIVSYDLAQKTLTFRQSWGPEWGKSGYAKFSFDAVQANLNDAWASIDQDPVALEVHG